MTRLTLTMPRLGETMEEGVILGWLVQPGDSFRRGQPLLEVESDKTVVEYPALGDGRLESVLAEAGTRLPVGANIAEVTVAEATEWAELSAGADAPAPQSAAAAGPSLLRMPQLGETMLDGVIVSWLVAEGQAYRRGEALLEIETDKTLAEVPALSDGTLLRILAGPGERLEVGTPIAEVDGEVDEAPAAAASAAPAPAPAAAPAPAVAAGRRTAPDGRPRATPLARRLARQHRMDLASITGTGRRGRIERQDIEAAVSAASPALPLSQDDPAWQPRAGGELAFSRQGEGGETFVLLHGFAADRTAWAQLAALLKRAGHSVITPDLPGHGATALEAASPEALADAVVAFAQSLPGRLVLVGHSLGAAVAVLAAGRLAGKLDRLELLAPAGCGPRIAADFVLGLAGGPAADEIPGLLSALGPKAGGLSAAALAQMAAELAKGRLSALAGALTSPDGAQRLDILPALAALPGDLPVRAVFGKDDQVVPVQDALNMPPQVAVHFLGAGHMPHWDLPAEVAALLLRAAGQGAAGRAKR